jgi:membrane protein
MVRSRVFGAGHSSSGAIAGWSLVKDTAASWSKHKAARLGAALAYYSIFSLGPLLVIAVAVAGLTFQQEAARGEVGTQLRALLGDAGAQAVNAMLLRASKPMEGTLATVLGVGALVFAAVGVVVQLKDALNTVWEVEPPKASCIWDFVRTYMISLAAVLSLGFLLLVSLLLTTALAAGGKYIAPYVPELAMHALGSATSFAMITLLFAMMFKWLPDTHVAWRDVWLGAAVTAALFEIGKVLIGLYIGKQALESTYGAAASLVVLLIWVYYSSQLVLMGAEFTRAYATRRALGNVSASDRRTNGGVDHHVQAAVERTPYAAALAALLVGWLWGRLEVRRQRAGGTTAA